MHISELFDEGLLREMVEGRYVRRFEHDSGDLVGYNYTQNAQWERVWNDVTRNCRGLLVATDGSVVARPFPKFFNYGDDVAEDARRLGQPFVLTEKLDGSLGIHYRWQGRDAIATRGSFNSPQAEWASERIGACGIDSPAGVTQLFEIIYPENRVVVDYGAREDLVFLAAIDWRTARNVDVFWPLSQRAASYEVPVGVSLDKIRGLWGHLDDGNFEGFVATFDDGHRVKIKLDEYLRLHRIMSSTSNRTIWEALRAGTDLAQMLESVPDEFFVWASDTIAGLRAAAASMETAARVEFDRLALAHGTADRKPFALAAKDSPNAPLLFAMLDGKDYSDTIWKRLRPEVIEYPPIGGAGEQAEVEA